MFKRFWIAAFAALIFAASGSAALLATATPASADQDDHHARHVNRPANPYGANGYWSNGSWHNRPNATWNNGRHAGWNSNHPKHRKHRKHDRDGNGR